MKLNCDMGESFGIWTMGLDDQVMPWIDMANIACGFHASDPDVMAATVKKAIQNNVTIGAHPGYEDKKGFGRRSVPHSQSEISHLVAYQVGALQGVCSLYGGKVEYVKPHGALYNDMMADKTVFEAVVTGVSSLSGNPSLMILATADNSQYQAVARAKGVSILLEAFADRAYTHEGKLSPRSQPGSVYHDSKQIIDQVTTLAKHGYVTALDGSKLVLNADTVCVHGDNPESVATVKALSKALTP
ncbi:5-oxoprolinase subunit PxpA [Parasalinivibrio latis]|uniref:5-oxoprolinase subunit PxpA n=1 Tax=Parasalinivibrio latis TaxID=2952610 RepID=UPI0030E38E18